MEQEDLNNEQSKPSFQVSGTSTSTQVVSNINPTTKSPLLNAPTSVTDSHAGLYPYVPITFHFRLLFS